MVKANESEERTSHHLRKLLDGHLGMILSSPELALSKYPAPALLLEPFDDSQPGAVSTPPRGDPALGETSTDVVATPAGSVRDLGLVHSEARVAWLAKSERNPFADQITIGRARNNDIVLNHPTVSKLHAIVRENEGRLFVEDMGSTNGTALDGVKIPAKQPRELNDGTSLRFGAGVIARFFEAESFLEFCRMLQK